MGRDSPRVKRDPQAGLGWGATKHGLPQPGHAISTVRHKEQPKPAPTGGPGPPGRSPVPPGVHSSHPEGTAPPSPGCSFSVWFGHPQLHGGCGSRRGPEPGRVNTAPGPALVVIN